MSCVCVCVAGVVCLGSVCAHAAAGGGGGGESISSHLPELGQQCGDVAAMRHHEVVVVVIVLEKCATDGLP